MQILSVQNREDLFGLPARVSAHFPDLAPVEIESSHTLDIAAIRHLVTLVVETLSAAAVGNQHLGATQDSHSTKQSGNFLPFAIQIYLTIQTGRSSPALAWQIAVFSFSRSDSRCGRNSA